MHIFFDIDNTLVSHSGTSHIPPETLEALRLLKANGHTPAIATGRARFLSELTAREFGIDSIVCSGGAQIVVKGVEIHTQYLPDDMLSDFRNVALRFPEITAAVDERYLYTQGAFDGFRAYFNAQAGYDCIRPLHEMTRAIMCYIMMPHSILTQSHGLFFAPPEGVRLELMHAFTEVRYVGSSKWDGIVRLVRHEGVSLDDVIVFGDGPNDIEMIERAKVGVAVGRAGEDVKSVADYVCEDIDEGGILKACRHLGLI